MYCRVWQLCLTFSALSFMAACNARLAERASTTRCRKSKHEQWWTLHMLAWSCMRAFRTFLTLAEKVVVGCQESRLHKVSNIKSAWFAEVTLRRFAQSLPLLHSHGGQTWMVFREDVCIKIGKSEISQTFPVSLSLALLLECCEKLLALFVLAICLHHSQAVSSDRPKNGRAALQWCPVVSTSSIRSILIH